VRFDGAVYERLRDEGKESERESGKESGRESGKESGKESLVVEEGEGEGEEVL